MPQGLCASLAESPDAIEDHRPTHCLHCGSSFDRRIHELTLYLKANQLFSYERLQGAFAGLFGLNLGEGPSTNMFKRTATAFEAERDEGLAALRTADVVAGDEIGAPIEGCNDWNWVFCSPHPFVHTIAFSRAAKVVRDTIKGRQHEV